jgi:hypothetical protein
MPATLLRRVFYIFVDNFHIIGTAAIWLAWRRTDLFRSRAWAVVAVVAVLQVIVVSVLGGAALERYLMPVLPLFYIATAAALTKLSVLHRRMATAIMTAGLVFCIFFSSPLAYPFENNSAFVTFVRLQQQAAEVLEAEYPSETIYSAWPLPDALRRPEFGYVSKELQVRGLDNFSPEAVLRGAAGARVLVVYSRTWEPRWGVLQLEWIRRFLAEYYFYSPQITAEQIERHLGLVRVATWQERDQWIEIWARKSLSETMIL